VSGRVGQRVVEGEMVGGNYKQVQRQSLRMGWGQWEGEGMGGDSGDREGAAR